MYWKAVCLLSGLLIFTSQVAGAESRVSSIPHAISEQHIYKVIILEIDSSPVEPRRHHVLDTGTHDVVVQLMLDLEWTLDQHEQPPMNYRQILRLETLPGKSYQLAARVDVDAPIESLMDGSFWSVFVYRETDL